MGAEADGVRSLAQAHEVLGRARPHRCAPLGEWLAFYQWSAAVYAEIAEIDRGHHHEALAMAEQERQLMTEIKAQIAAQGPAAEEGRQ